MEKNEILVIYGNNPREMAGRLAEAAGLAELIGSRERRIGLKPNLVVARPACEGATTHPEIVRGIAEYLQKNGFHRLAVIEGAWVGARTKEAFSVCGYNALAREMGLTLIDTQDDQARPYDCRGMDIEICESAREVDFMINLPVMKGHCQTLLTCALKNNKGIIPNREKRRFHSLGLHKPIAHLNTVAKNDFILVDGICGDLDFEEGGTPVPAGRMFAARDPVLCDAWAASQMGYAPEEIPYIGLAEKLGVGCGDPAQARLRELNRSADGAPMPRPEGKARQLALYIREERACSACYAALVFALSRMKGNELGRLRGPVSIGQGFAGKPGALGIGRCTSRFAATLEGCPPSASAILDFLRNQL
ncbi:MAG: DUF362 domain-containing protein [Spirochaetaceae bacterium]|jgi:uncharacterized protein (DUF362 family)|nr:DUF362 domain-containing protein [Spirochaetaceae bacterium]